MSIFDDEAAKCPARGGKERQSKQKCFSHYVLQKRRRSPVNSLGPIPSILVYGFFVREAPDRDDTNPFYVVETETKVTADLDRTAQMIERLDSPSSLPPGNGTASAFFIFADLLKLFPPPPPIKYGSPAFPSVHFRARAVPFCCCCSEQGRVSMTIVAAR